MLNYIFFISETYDPFKGNLPTENNTFLSVIADAADKEQLENAYAFFTTSTHAHFALTLSVRAIPPAENIRIVASFLFLSTYLRCNYIPVINLTGTEPELLSQTASLLLSYMSSQGIDPVTINTITPAENNNKTDTGSIFSTSEAIVNYYNGIFKTDQFYDKKIFFHTESASILHSVYASLQQVEADFRRQNPALYELAENKMMMGKKIVELERRQRLTETELNNQKQYVSILRSDHAARELQDYYDNEYEILPVWFKRFGHLIKAINGKRSFKSLFRNDVKKYKD